MIVLDASAAMEIVAQTENAASLKDFLLAEEKVISCDLLRAETASVCRKLARMKRIEARDAVRYLSEATDLVDEYYPMETLQTEALAESIRLDHSAYDMFYFVLARRTASALVTLDRKLVRLCGQHGVRCITASEVEI